MKCSGSFLILDFRSFFSLCFLVVMHTIRCDSLMFLSGPQSMLEQKDAATSTIRKSAQSHLVSMAQEGQIQDLKYADTTPCDENAYDSTYETGGPSSNFMKIHYDGAGSYFRGSRKTWDAARLDCVANGGDLLIIPNKQYYDFLIAEQIIPIEATWIGAEDKDMDSAVHWVDGTQMTLDYGWPAEVRQRGRTRGSSLACISVTKHQGFRDEICLARKDYLCSLTDLGTEQATLRIEGRSPSRNFMKVGETLTLRCEAIMLKNASLQLGIGKIIELVAGESLTNVTTSLSMLLSVTDKAYGQRGVRCVPWFNVTVVLVMTKELDGKMVGCCSRNKQQPHCVNTTLAVKAKPRKPVVTLADANGAAAIMGQTGTYKCVAMPGDGEAVALAVISPKEEERWVKVFIVTGEEEEHGRQPTWISHIGHVNSSDPWWGGNYFNITVDLHLTAGLQYLACYSSSNVLDLVKKSKSYRQLKKKLERELDAEEYNKGPLTIRYLATGVNFSYPDPPIFLNQTDTEVTVYGCDLLTFVCDGYVGNSNNSRNRTVLQVSFKNGEENYIDSRDTAVLTHTDLITFEIEALEDFVKGPIVSLRASIRVLKDAEDITGLSCRFDGSREDGFNYQQDVQFNIEQGHLPPKLEPSFTFNKGDNTTKRLLAKCTTCVGADYHMTWEITDSDGGRALAVISKYGRIEWIHRYPGLQITYITSNYDSVCGNVIESEIFFNVPTTLKSANVTCYAWHIFTTGEVKSRFNKTELSVTVLLYGKGSKAGPADKKKRDRGTLILLLLIFGPFVALLTGGVVWYKFFMWRSKQTVGKPKGTKAGKKPQKAAKTKKERPPKKERTKKSPQRAKTDPAPPKADAEVLSERKSGGTGSAAGKAPTDVPASVTSGAPKSGSRDGSKAAA